MNVEMDMSAGIRDLDASENVSPHEGKTLSLEVHRTRSSVAE